MEIIASLFIQTCMIYSVYLSVGAGQNQTQEPVHILHELMSRWTCNEFLRALEHEGLGDLAECLKKALCGFTHSVNDTCTVKHA